MFADFGEGGKLADHWIVNLFFETVFARVIQPVVVRLPGGTLVPHQGRSEPGEEWFRQTGQDGVEAGDQPSPAADGDLADRMAGAVQDGVGHDVGRIDRLGVLGGVAGEITRVLAVRAVDRGRLDQADGDRGVLAHQLHAQGVGETLHRVLRGRIDALDRQGRVGQDGADIDDGPAALAQPQVLGRHQRAVDHAPVVGFEQPPLVIQAGHADGTVDRDAGIVDPGVEAAEQAHAFFRRLGQGRMVGHVGDGPGRAGARGLELLGKGLQVAFAARDQEDAGPRPRRPTRRRQADAGGSAGDDDGLFVQGLERRFGHETAGSVCSYRAAGTGPGPRRFLL